MYFYTWGLGCCHLVTNVCVNIASISPLQSTIYKRRKLCSVT
jgi:hypothetical protein